MLKRIKSIVLASILMASFSFIGAVPVSGTSVSSSAGSNTSDASDRKISFKEGTYTGTAKGFHGDIKVTVTLGPDGIKSVETEHSETEGIGDEAVKIMEKSLTTDMTLADSVSGATYSSEGFKEAFKKAVESAGLSLSDFEKKNENTEALKTEEAEFDVVVIGGGGAGLAAAMAAHQKGASVCVIEKMPKLGGNTIISGSAYNAVDPERQKSLTMTENEKETVEKIIAEEQNDPLVKEWQETLKKEWEEYKASGSDRLLDSPSLHKLQTYNGGDKKGDPKLIEILGEGAPESIKWLEANGMEFKDRIFTVLGGLWNRAHKPVKPLGIGLIETYTNYIAAHPDIKVYLNTKAKDLIEENGIVTGVKAEGEGKAYTIKAKKGVVMATGGFGNNPEMRDKYNTIWPSLTNLKSTNHPGATGDGITMGEKVKAKLEGMEYIQLLPMGDPETGSLLGNIEQGVQDRIFVNKEGKRFVDEGERRDVMTKALMEQPDAWMWVIVDKHSYPTGDTKNNFNESIDELVAAGKAFKEDTIEELAEKIKVDAGVLKEDIDTFNKAVSGEIKDPFGRTLFDNKIDTPPFYAAARVPTVHHTMGGLYINQFGQVLNADNQPIKGLYAAGEVTGGIHGTNRLGGNALADITVFGKIAGESAAEGR